MSEFHEPAYGPRDHVYARFPMDETTGVAGEGSMTRFINPLWWVGKKVTYVTEWHAHNLFRREVAENSPYRWTEEEPLSAPVRRERDGLCWTEQRWIRRTWTADRILVTQKYSVHRMNMTKAAYYAFLTGDGGLSVDLAVDGSALAAGGLGYTANTAAGHIGTRVGANIVSGTAPATTARLTQVGSNLARVGQGLQASSRALGLVGWGVLVFSGTTWLIRDTETFGADVTLSTGWMLVRVESGDRRLEDSGEIFVKQLTEPAPCSETTEPERPTTGTLVGPGAPPTVPPPVEEPHDGPTSQPAEGPRDAAEQLLQTGVPGAERAHDDGSFHDTRVGGVDECTRRVRWPKGDANDHYFRGLVPGETYVYEWCLRNRFRRVVEDEYVDQIEERDVGEPEKRRDGDQCWLVQPVEVVTTRYRRIRVEQHWTLRLLETTDHDFYDYQLGGLGATLDTLIDGTSNLADAAEEAAKAGEELGRAAGAAARHAPKLKALSAMFLALQAVVFGSRDSGSVFEERGRGEWPIADGWVTIRHEATDPEHVSTERTTRPLTSPEPCPQSVLDAEHRAAVIWTWLRRVLTGGLLLGLLWWLLPSSDVEPSPGPTASPSGAPSVTPSPSLSPSPSPSPTEIGLFEQFYPGVEPGGALGDLLEGYAGDFGTALGGPWMLPVGSNFFSDPRASEVGYQGFTDLAWTLAGTDRREQVQQLLDPVFNNTSYPCGQTRPALVVCAPEAGPFEGPFVTVVGVLAEPVPLDGDLALTYALVAETNGDPGDDYQASAPFEWDFFQGTDRWIEVNHAPGAGWQMIATDVPGGAVRGNVGTDARLVIDGTLLVWFVPLSEIGDDPRVRISAFHTDGTFAPATSGADIWPGDPAAGDWSLFSPPDVTVVGEPVPVEDEPAAEDPDPVSLIEQFYVEFAAALNVADLSFTLERLHPAVIERYGREQCEAVLSGTDQVATSFEVLSVAGPEPWDWELDDRSTPIAVSWEVALERTVNGDVLDQPVAHVTVDDGVVRWFTDCGEPR